MKEQLRTISPIEYKQAYSMNYSPYQEKMGLNFIQKP